MAHAQKNPPSRDQLTGPFIETAIRLGALAILLYWTLILVRPFISIVIWSVVLTVALYPVFESTALRLGGRRPLSAFLVTILSLLIVIGPATWLALGLIESLRTIYERLDLSNLAIAPPSQTVKGWPLIGDRVYGNAIDEFPRQALHAWRVRLAHPVSGQQIRVVAPLPPELQGLLTGLGFQLSVLRHASLL